MIQWKLGKIWNTHSLRCPKNTFPEVFYIFFFHLISNGLNGVSINSLTLLWLYYKYLRNIFSKGTQTFNFMKPNVIWKLSYRVKYINKINGDFRFHVFWKFKNKIFLNSIVNNMEKISTKIGTQSPKSSVQYVEIIFTLVKCDRSIDNSIDFYIFVSLWKASW